MTIIGDTPAEASFTFFFQSEVEFFLFLFRSKKKYSTFSLFFLPFSSFFLSNEKQVPPPSSAPTVIVPPTAYDDNYNTVGNTPVSMEVCINDTPGTGGTQPFTVTLVTTPEAGGTLSAAGCTMTYTPNAATTPPVRESF